MNNNYLFPSLYRTLVPKFIHKKIIAKRVLPKAILNYYNSLEEIHSKELSVALDYLKSKPLNVFPHTFQDKYDPTKVEVFYDIQKKMNFVLLDGKRLFYKRKMSKNRIQKLFNLAQKEQDIKSPHRYITPDFNFENGSILVDVGAAEGNFSLSVVEKADRIFLFETDKQWIEALEATFAPWKEKVTIVNKFVGDQTTGKFIRLDDFFKDLSGNYFLKVDVEGAESELIHGAENLFTMAKNIKAVICTYHKQNDQYEIDNLLKKSDFTTHFSDGFMLFYYDKKIGPPYFRKGLVRAEKNSKI